MTDYIQAYQKEINHYVKKWGFFTLMTFADKPYPHITLQWLTKTKKVSHIFRYPFNYNNPAELNQLLKGVEPNLANHVREVSQNQRLETAKIGLANRQYNWKRIEQ